MEATPFARCGPFIYTEENEMRKKVEATNREKFPKMYWLLDWFEERGLTGFAQELRHILEDRTEDSLDPVTGLVQRRYFMRDLMQNANAQLPELEESGILSKDCRIIVFAGDFAFLNFFNAQSHARGDEVLYRAGEILVEVFPNCLVCRFGGDEFVILIIDPLPIALQRKKRAQSMIAEEPYNILDIEYATMDDVKELLNLFPLPKERRVKFVVQALIDIAMARAQIAKCLERIKLLIDAYIADTGIYEELIDYARKGAGNISDSEVRVLAAQAKAGQNISLDCLAFALNAREKKMSGDLYTEAVFKVAENIFVHKHG